MEKEKNKKNNILGLAFVGIWIAFSVNPVFGIIVLCFAIFFILKKGKKDLPAQIASLLQNQSGMFNYLIKKSGASIERMAPMFPTTIVESPLLLAPPIISRLERKTRYLQVALNSQSIHEAIAIANLLPKNQRILIEAGTPLIKKYGTKIVRTLKQASPSSYIVADTKCADLSQREVEMMAQAGANAITCLGVAPIETIDLFISECKNKNVDSMVDMMNVESPILILKKLKQLPDVVILHRGVDESEFSKEKQIPLYQIKQIKGNYKTLVSVAGGDSIIEVRRAIFNDADIVVVWKDFYQLNSNTADLAKEFLQEIK